MPEGTETITDTTETAPPDTGTTDGPTVDHAAEAEKWKAQARKHEDRAKANATAAKELENLKLASMGETEKAVEAGKAEARTAALAEVGGKLVAAEFKVAANGRIDVDTLLSGLDTSKFLTEDGDPDTDAITAWVDKVAPAENQAPAGFPPPPDLGQGVRSGTTAKTPQADFASFIGGQLKR